MKHIKTFKDINTHMVNNVDNTNNSDSYMSVKEVIGSVVLLVSLAFMFVLMLLV